MTISVNIARSPEEAELQAAGKDVMAEMFEKDVAGFIEERDETLEPGEIAAEPVAEEAAPADEEAPAEEAAAAEEAPAEEAAADEAPAEEAATEEAAPSPRKRPRRPRPTAMTGKASRPTRPESPQCGKDEAVGFHAGGLFLC